MVTLEFWRQQNPTSTIAQDTNGLGRWNAVIASKHSVCQDMAQADLEFKSQLYGTASVGDFFPLP